MSMVAAPETIPKKPPEGARCDGCGHWSVGTEHGIDDRSGYCERWEKITRRDFACYEFISKAKYDAYQDHLAHQHEDPYDDDF